MFRCVYMSNVGKQSKLKCHPTERNDWYIFRLFVCSTLTHRLGILVWLQVIALLKFYAKMFCRKLGKETRRNSFLVFNLWFGTAWLSKNQISTKETLPSMEKNWLRFCSTFKTFGNEIIEDRKFDNSGRIKKGLNECEMDFYLIFLGNSRQ